jgi:putative ABC transport system permease protein
MMLIRNYLLVALRFFKKYFASTLINMASIAIGLTCFLVIGLFIGTELSYNSCFEKAPNIARVSLSVVQSQSGETTDMALANNQLVDELRNSYPEIERVTGVDPIQEKVKVSYHGKSFYEGGFAWVDSSYPLIFNHKWISGSPLQALSKPNQVVLTAELAIKLFGSANATSQIVEVDGESFTITGVIEASPINTSFAYRALLSSNVIKNDWCFVYALFSDSQSIHGFQEKLNQHFEDTIGPILAETGFSGQYNIEPLQSIHLGPNKLFDSPKGSVKILSILFVIALVIFLISLSNHINLSISQTIARTREIGIRKSLGAWIQHILIQYYVETILFFLFALTLSGVGCFFALHYLREYKVVGYLPPIFLWVIIPFVTLLIILIGSLISSTYVLRQITKNSITQHLRFSGMEKSKGVLMKSLIVTQIIVLAGLSFTSFVLRDQMSFLINGNRGFNKEKILVIDIPANNNASGKIIRESLLPFPFVSEISVIGHNSSPSSELFFDGFRSDNEEEGMLTRVFKYIKVDPSYTDVLQLTITEGRGFRVEDLDRQFILVNQMVVNQMGWKTPIGQSLSGNQVIGVVNDFSFNGLHRPIEPLVIKLNDENPVQVLLKYKSLDQNQLNQIKEKWKSVLNDQPFEYYLLDQRIALENERENLLQFLIVFFSVIAGLIACLGLFGLINTVQEKNSKSQCIKKIFGASNLRLLYEGWRRFGMLFLLSFAIAFPLTWIITNRWLSAFPNRITVGIIPFLETILVVILVGSITILYHHIRIIKLSPLNILRNE